MKRENKRKKKYSSDLFLKAYIYKTKYFLLQLRAAPRTTKRNVEKIKCFFIFHIFYLKNKKKDFCVLLLEAREDKATK